MRLTDLPEPNAWEHKKNARQICPILFYRTVTGLRSSFSMIYPQGPQLNTQGFPELFGEGGGGGGGGGDFVGWT